MPAAPEVEASRRRLVADGLGILATALAFGFAWGLAARTAGFSPIEASAMSLLAFGGAAQFAAVGYVAAGAGWPAILLLTAFLNARHLLYGAVLAPYFADRSRALRAGLAHLLTDDAFALSLAHFRRIGRADLWGYAFAGIAATFVPWNLATLAGSIVGGSIPDPSVIGLDIVFPAAMAGLAVGLIGGRRDVLAAGLGVLIAIGVGLTWDPSAGVVAGGILGPLVALVVPGLEPEPDDAGTDPPAEVEHPDGMPQ
jgi:4-azaleucine resistance transporter AzlC